MGGVYQRHAQVGGRISAEEFSRIHGSGTEAWQETPL